MVRRQRCLRKSTGKGSGLRFGFSQNGRTGGFTCGLGLYRWQNTQCLAVQGHMALRCREAKVLMEIPVKSFCVLVVDTHRLIPTDNAVRATPSIVCRSESQKRTPRLGAPVRCYRTLASRLGSIGNLGSAKSTTRPPEFYEETRRSAAALATGDKSLSAEHTRGTVMGHRY